MAKISIELEIHETTSRSRSGQMFKDYNLTYKPKNIPDLIKYLESKKYKIIAFDATVDRLCTYRASQIIEEGVKEAVIEVVVGGGDDYQVALAIFNSVLCHDILLYTT